MPTRRLLCWVAVAGLAAPHRADAAPPAPRLTILSGGKNPLADFVQSVAFTPDGKHLVVRSTWPARRRTQQLLDFEKDFAVGVYDAATGRQVSTAEFREYPLLSEDFHDGRLCVIPRGGDWFGFTWGGTFRCLELPRNRPPDPPTLPDAAIQKWGRVSLWPAADDDTLLVAAQPEHGRYTLMAFDAGKNTTRDLLTGGDPDRFASCVALSPFGRRFVVGLRATLFRGPDTKPLLHCWSYQGKPQMISVPQELDATALELSPDGRVVAAGYGDGSVAWYDAATGKKVDGLRPGRQWTVSRLAFHLTGKFLACGTLDRKGEPNLFVLQIDPVRVLARVAADPGGVQGVCFSPSGDRLATFGSKGVAIWDAAPLLAPPPN